MEEFGTQYEAEVLQNKKKLDKCDLLCFVFDSSDVNSFSYVVNLRVSLGFGVCGHCPIHDSQLTAILRASLETISFGSFAKCVCGNQE